MSRERDCNKNLIDNKAVLALADAKKYQAIGVTLREKLQRKEIETLITILRGY